MQHSDSDQVAIKILGKDLIISCPREAQQQLIEAAQQLDQRMQTIKTGSKAMGLDRIAMMAALNLTHELIGTQQQLTDLQQQLTDQQHQQQSLSDRISSMLATASIDQP